MRSSLQMRRNFKSTTLAPQGLGRSTVKLYAESPPWRPGSQTRPKFRRIAGPQHRGLAVPFANPQETFTMDTPTDIVCLQRLGSLADGTARYAVPRYKWYQLAKQYPGLLKRLFGRTYIDFAIADEIVNNLPDYRAAPAGQRGHLANMPEGTKLSKTVRDARAKRAAADAAQGQ